MKRRDFLKYGLATGAAAGGRPEARLKNRLLLDETFEPSWVEARHYVRLPDREIECRLCPRLCRLGDRERGYCGVRENRDGTYYTLVYGKACAVHADPIEKKPFFHFLPGRRALSIATAGCNVNCQFCQNWEISQVRPEQIHHSNLPPREVVATAEKHDCPVIAYTYSEPIVFFEYMMDSSKEARRKSLRNVVVTGGHVNPEPLAELLEVVDAVKIDLKAFTQDFYSRYVHGELAPVLDAIRTVAASRVWLEIVYLVIPTLNDDPALLRRMCAWLREEVGSEIPLHFSRFHPAYLLKNLPPTPVSDLERARDIALDEGLKFVYIGNIPGHEAENTSCPGCGKRIVERNGYRIGDMSILEGKCLNCGRSIPGIWD